MKPYGARHKSVQKPHQDHRVHIHTFKPFQHFRFWCLNALLRWSLPLVAGIVPITQRENCSSGGGPLPPPGVNRVMSVLRPRGWMALVPVPAEGSNGKSTSHVWQQPPTRALSGTLQTWPSTVASDCIGKSRLELEKYRGWHAVLPFLAISFARRCRWRACLVSSPVRFREPCHG